MKKPRSANYYDFYQEIAQTDYLVDIEIQDEYEKPSDATHQGLSDEQVSQIARDSLRDARRSKSTTHPSHQSQPLPEPGSAS
jgi:hypothetical protein